MRRTSLVTRKGSLWISLTSTTTPPGTGDGTWQLAVKSDQSAGRRAPHDHGPRRVHGRDPAEIEADLDQQIEAELDPQVRAMMRRDRAMLIGKALDATRIKNLERRLAEAEARHACGWWRGTSMVRR